MSGLESRPHEESRPPLHAYVAEDFQLQRQLIQFAYPNDPQAALKWVQGDETTHAPPLAEAFGDYFQEMKTRGKALPTDMAELLAAVKDRAGQTLH